MTGWKLYLKYLGIVALMELVGALWVVPPIRGFGAFVVLLVALKTLDEVRKDLHEVEAREEILQLDRQLEHGSLSTSKTTTWD